MEVPQELVNHVRTLQEDTECAVRVNGPLSPFFSIASGVKQGDPIAPFLFNLALEGAIGDLHQDQEHPELLEQPAILAFADDLAVAAETKEELAAFSGEIERNAARLGLKLSPKTGFMVVTRRPQDPRHGNQLRVGPHVFKRVTAFKCLGSTVSEDGKMYKEFRQRVLGGLRACSNDLKQCLHALHDTGATVASLTFDGNSVNVTMTECLGAQMDARRPDFQPWFLHPVSQAKVFVVLDAAHMIKLLWRNILGNSTVKILDSNNREIKWLYLVKLHEFQDREGLLAGNKHPDCFGCEATAEYIRIADMVFDILNSKNFHAKKKQNRPICQENYGLFKKLCEEGRRYICGLQCSQSVHKVLEHMGLSSEETQRMLNLDQMADTEVLTDGQQEQDTGGEDVDVGEGPGEGTDGEHDEHGVRGPDEALGSDDVVQTEVKSGNWFEELFL
ncbi:Retrovirus-related Pol polyprotein from type-1 retrotransposable element R2 [Frankliniella fusca]|uniref:Retrovirus-related Pol polyprotein from type-1 retrotransposable element R2 n=1 Tax=Frankliniella fusca TaxID=407009 RepID=A0AAE1GRC9_9NEOP|nr:Retrovirus-related Pol polyprotein from type-1 retrotransposable element R2 [Frankliniella fusca]